MSQVYRSISRKLLVMPFLYASFSDLNGAIFGKSHYFRMTCYPKDYSMPPIYIRGGVVHELHPRFLQLFSRVKCEYEFTAFLLIGEIKRPTESR